MQIHERLLQRQVPLEQIETGDLHHPKYRASHKLYLAHMDHQILNYYHAEFTTSIGKMMELLN